ncbi:MAG: hypothetical protein HYS13_08810 [Planctomycetia bacterium]|nr:hypothetical protein [Planctomycetia bacterium]
MEQPDEDFIHENEESYFEFGRDGRGEFHFGDVHCEMDCRLGTRDGRKAVEFTFEGGIGADAATGRGWAVLHGTSLEGRLFFHFGDDSSFTAVKVTQRVAGVRRKG